MSTIPKTEIESTKSLPDHHDTSDPISNASGPAASTGVKRFWKTMLYEDQLTPRILTLPGNCKAVEIVSSNFNLIIRDENGALWAVGMGEYDRNMVIEPIPVQQAIQGQLDFNDAIAPQATIHTSGMLKKGYQRVMVITQPTYQLSTYQTKCPIFEIVVHQGEAYLQELSDWEELNSANATEPSLSEPIAGNSEGMGSNVQKGQVTERLRTVVDISSGWKHSGMLCI